MQAKISMKTKLIATKGELTLYLHKIQADISTFEYEWHLPESNTKVGPYKDLSSAMLDATERGFKLSKIQTQDKGKEK